MTRPRIILIALALLLALFFGSAVASGTLHVGIDVWLYALCGGFALFGYVCGRIAGYRAGRRAGFADGRKTGTWWERWRWNNGDRGPK